MIRLPSAFLLPLTMRLWILPTVVMALFSGCGTLQVKMRGMQVALGPCESRYTAWRRNVEADGEKQADAAAHRLISCMREHGVTGPIALVTRDVYGATPPPLLGRGPGRRDLDVYSLDLFAAHYSIPK